MHEFEIRLSHHHRYSHRPSNDEHHLLTPSSRHGRLSRLQARTAGGCPRARDARRACRRVGRGLAGTDDGNGRDDGLAAVGECARVHDGAGRGGMGLGA